MGRAPKILEPIGLVRAGWEPARFAASVGPQDHSGPMAAPAQSLSTPPARYSAGPWRGGS